MYDNEIYGPIFDFVIYFHTCLLAYLRREREREEKNIPDVYEHMAGMAFGHSRMIRSRIDMPSNAFIVARPELQLEDFLGEW